MKGAAVPKNVLIFDLWGSLIFFRDAGFYSRWMSHFKCQGPRYQYIRKGELLLAMHKSGASYPGKTCHMIADYYYLGRETVFRIC